jgi:AmmeMemoRadiSam system protein B
MFGDVQDVRPAAVAGTFYPANAGELRRVVDAYLANAGVAPSPDACPKAVIVPHAGYIYSGSVAASAFARVAAYGHRIARIVLVGPAHRLFVDGLAAPGAAHLRTPLGDVEVDRAAAELPAHPAAHAREHCLEVELPFLQRVAPHAKIVPVIGSRARPDEVAALLDRLWGGAETLFVISSDLSHYEPYVDAARHDARTAARIVALDATIAAEDACGAIGINGLLWLARRRRLRVELVDLRSSGDTAGTRDEVVGYGAFAAYEER